MMKSSLLLSMVAGLAMLAVPNRAPAGVFLSITVAPPALPVYVQPPCPAEGLIWTPGYWAYGPVGYYWVPGAWVAPPRVGLLWTPAYWGFAGGFYGFHSGYWGPHVGFYGGVNYGFGYGGFGYAGGEWRGERFVYNTAVTRVNTTVVHNTYINRTVINNTAINNSRASFNGPGGVNARPRQEETIAEREQHVQATANQVQQERVASSNRAQFASVNHGQPTTAAVARPFNGQPQNRLGPQGGGPHRNAFQHPLSEQPRAFAQSQRPNEAHPNTPQQFNQPNRPEFNQRRNEPQARPQEASRPRPEQARPEPARHEAEHHFEHR